MTEREAQAPHDFQPEDDDRFGERVACAWCGITEAEMKAADGQRDLCGFLPSERWQEGE